MAEQPVKADRSVWLREFLARNDVRCEQCGYNLQNIVEPICPECGFVIPRPGTDAELKAVEGTRPHWRLWCIHCGQDVRGVSGDVCTGCGKSLCVAKVNVVPREGSWFLPGVPRLYIGLCAAFVLAQVCWVVWTIYKPGTANPRTISALVVSLLPHAALWAWAAHRKEIAERGWHGRAAKNAYRLWFLCLGVFLVLMVVR